MNQIFRGKLLFGLEIKSQIIKDPYLREITKNHVLKAGGDNQRSQD